VKGAAQKETRAFSGTKALADTTDIQPVPLRNYAHARSPMRDTIPHSMGTARFAHPNNIP